MNEIKNINQQEQIQEEDKICNCCFEEKNLLIDCNNTLCKYRMCVECHFKWYINKYRCPHCRVKQKLILKRKIIIKNTYDGYLLRKFYFFMLGLFLLISISIPIIVISLIYTNTFLYFIKCLGIFYFLMNPIVVFNYCMRKLTNIINLVFRFYNSLEYILDEITEEYMSLF